MSDRIATIDGKKHIWLQSVGYVPAKPIESFKKGDKIAYNFGYVYDVVSGPKKTSPKFYSLKVKSPEGKIYTQKVKSGTYKPYQRKKR